MDMKLLDNVLTFGSLIIGILLLTGHGSVFMKGGDEVKRRKMYDEKKMERASGVALILIGLATGIDSYTTGLYAKLGYVAAIAVICGGFVYYIKAKCKK